MAAEKLPVSAEFAMRLPSALASVAAVLLTYLIGLELTRSKRAAFISAAMLLTTAGFVEAGRQARPDALVLAFILLAFWGFARGLMRENASRWFLLFGAGVGLAVMTKDAIGLLAYLFACAAALAFQKWDWLWSKYFWLGQLLAAAIAAPWHAYMTAEFGASFWKTYILTHVFMRYETNLIGNNTSILTYVSYLADYASPWIVLFLVGIIALFAFRRFGGANSPAHLMLLLSALGVFALFSAASTKIPFYLLPMLPFVALFAGMIAHEALSAFRPRWRKWFAGFLVACFAGAFALAIYRGYDLDPSFNIEHRLAGDERSIGLILASDGTDLPIRFADPIYWETIRFYSRGRQLGSFDPAAAYGAPFLLVVPTYKVNHYPYFETLAADSEIIFKGDYFTLMKIGGGSSGMPDSAQGSAGI
jgi:4-amino-4-deoxy-L-arabinose transferase-like glycosyltransferase